MRKLWIKHFWMTAWMRAFSGKNFLIYMWEGEAHSFTGQSESSSLIQKTLSLGIICTYAWPLPSTQLPAPQSTVAVTVQTHTPALARALTGCRRRTSFTLNIFGVVKTPERIPFHEVISRLLGVAVCQAGVTSPRVSKVKKKMGNVRGGWLPLQGNQLSATLCSLQCPETLRDETDNSS